ncbi:aldehyde oxidase [Sulfolobales archaeon HS-7]|nr:aldehyde oxidase [Sulfolobales archaeon HS-7]
MKRTDVVEPLRGRGGFVDDFDYKGKYVSFVRSPYPHARILKIDYTDVTRKGGHVFTGKDIRLSAVRAGEREGGETSSILARDKVRYLGEPVTMIVGDDPYLLEDLKELVVVDYEPLEPISSIERALKDDVLVFENLKSNLVLSRETSFGSLPKNDKQIELELYWSRSSGNPIEPYAAVVIPQGDSLKIISNQQAPYAVIQEVEKAVGVKINHIPARHGGSFGAKFSLSKYLTVLAYASKKLDLPLKWIETRTEHLLASNSSGPERKFKARAYFKPSGEVTGLDFEIWEDIGASTFAGQPFKPTGILAGPYKIRNIRYLVNLVATNKNPPGAFRGAGTPPHTWALERVMDNIADELGIERSTVRKINLIDSFPYEAPYAVYESGNPRKLLELALSRNDLFSLRNNNIGVGIATSTDPSTPSGSEGVRLSIKNGKIVIGLGYGPEGQGNEDSARILVSKFLDIPIDMVEYQIMDNMTAPQSFGPGGSRMAAFLSGAIAGASEELLARLRRKAFSILGEGLEYKSGHFYNDRGKLSITQLGEENVDFIFSLQSKTRFNAYPFACDVAVVRVDEDKITPIKQVVYIDSGVPIDEDLVKEQVIGGTAIGISLALYESYKYSDDGYLLTTSLADYGMPSAADLPEIEVNIEYTPSTSNPYGAKGIGEIPVGVAAAAVTSAVEDVIKRKITKIPIVPL